MKSGRCLNILVIASRLPFPANSGGPIRLFNLYSRLATEHRLTWMCPIRPEDQAYVLDAERFCERVIELPNGGELPLPPNRGWRRLIAKVAAHLHWERLYAFCVDYVRAPGLYWAPAIPEKNAVISEVVGSSDFDLIVCESIASVELAPEGIDIPRVVTLFDMQSTLFSRVRWIYSTTWEDRLFFLPELLKIILYERRNYARYNLAITVSLVDKRRLQNYCPALPIAVIPNGVDLAYYQVTSGPSVSNLLVYVGNYAYPPNADAILYFCREILPLIRQRIADVQVCAVGHQPPAELSKYEGVNGIGSVLDVRPFLARAEVVIVPLRVGSGTRIKIVEALAMGKAVVSTALGAEGLDVTHGQDILLANKPSEFADCVIRLLEQPHLRTRLGTNGRRMVEQEYDWAILAEKFSHILHQVVTAKASRVA